jgi:hypothetical protein
MGVTYECVVPIFRGSTSTDNFRMRRDGMNATVFILPARPSPHRFWATVDGLWLSKHLRKQYRQSAAAPCTRGIEDCGTKTITNAPPELTVSLQPFGLFPANNLLSSVPRFYAHLGPNEHVHE